MPTELKIYDVPKGLESKSGYTVTVDGHTLGLYDARVLFPPFQFVKRAPYGLFDFSGTVHVEITSPVAIEQVDIRPKSHPVSYSFDQHCIRIELNRPAKLSVELNGSIENVVHLFANPIETDVPSPNDPDVIYFAPGIYDIGDDYIIESGKTVYLAGGAYLYGKLITADQSENIKILGRGILDGFKSERNNIHTVELQFTKNLLMSGITIVDAPNWTCRVFGSDRVEIHNVNIFGCRGNTDGVDVCGSRDVEVYDMFIRNWDDALAVKAFETGNVRNIYFHDCIVWNDFARPIEVGYENRADDISGVHYRNIDIIHSMSGYPLIGIHEGDRADIHDILFEDIRVEDALGGQFIDLRIKPSAWNRDKAPGRIHDVTFRNIYLNGKPGLDKLPEKSRLEGYSEQSTIEDIVFDNVYISGKRITSAEECGLNCLAYTKNIRFVAPSAPVPAEELLVPVQSRLSILSKTLGDHGYYEINATISAENLSAEHTAQGSFWLEAYPKTECSGLDNVLFDYCLAPGQRKEYAVQFRLRSGKYFVTTQSRLIDVKLDWKLLELETPVEFIGDGTYDELRARLKEYTATEQDMYSLDGKKSGAVAVAHTSNALVLGGKIIDLAACGKIKPVLDNPDMIYSCLNVPKKDSCIDIYASEHNPPALGEVMFLIPETGFGETTALQMGETGPVVASELRNIAEITYVFKNQPKVSQIGHVTLTPEKDGAAAGDGYEFFAVIPYTQLGIAAEEKHFLMDIVVNTVLPGTTHYDSVAMYHSLRPEACVQMFGRFYLK